jgi:hypothetical protein
MTDAAAQAPSNGQPTTETAALAPEAAAATGAASPGLPPAPVSLPPVADERPELAVGAAFAGGLVLALFLKRLAR